MNTTLQKLRGSLVALALACALERAATAQEPPTTTAVADPAKAEARERFTRGLEHLDQGRWDQALVEFRASRALFPTRANTKNTAICLAHLGRADEALELYQSLLGMADLSTADAAYARGQITELQARVGTVEIRDAPVGASITIDGVERGQSPLAPLSLHSGTHSIRVFKENFLPFESKFEVAGRQSVVVKAQLAVLTQAGRLRVSEKTGRELTVWVDGAKVGRTPWEGALAPGSHTIQLGEGGVGTQPGTFVVNVNQVALAELTAEQLESALRIAPAPPTARVTLDGVDVGKGIWEGHVRRGAHRIRVTLDGYEPWQRDVTLAPRTTRNLDVPLVAFTSRAGIALELDAALALGAIRGGDLAAQCGGGCSSHAPLGGSGILHAGYQFPSGLGVGLHAGILAFAARVTSRAEQLFPVGLDPLAGPVNDRSRVTGLVAGVDAQYRRGKTWPLTFRLGLGTFIGSTSNQRIGNFVDSTSAPFSIDARQSDTTVYLYSTPEMRVGRRFGEHFELNVGVAVMLMAGVRVPAWEQNTTVNAGTNGYATFSRLPTDGSTESLLGSFMLQVLPGLGARYEF